MMALIAQLACGSLAYLVGFLRSMRIMAPQALSLGNRVMQIVSLGIHTLVA
jgi:hypothetical protein